MAPSRLAASKAALVNSSKIQLDLSSLCRRHYRFLKTLHEDGITQHVSSESLRRYELWMQLLGKTYSVVEEISDDNRKLLTPPKDVAWLWHCHRLAPVQYEEYIQTNFMGLIKEANGCARLLEFKDPCGDPYDVEPNAYSEQIWKRFYPNEPFELDTTAAAASISLQGFDLLTSAKQQAEFYWQIQPYFEGTDTSPPTLDSKLACENYYKFLSLLRDNPKLSYKLVPTYEIDLMWHTHMTAGSMFQYHSDCEAIFGRILDHDDSYGNGDRSREGVLTLSFQKTAELWKKAYQDSSYASRGGYRGPPPENYFPQMAEAPVTVTATLVEEAAPEVDPESLAVKPPSDKDDDSTPKSCKTKCCIGMIGSFVVGAAFIILGMVVFTPVGYVCDTPPTQAEIAQRGAPVCLKTNFLKKPMCLESDLNRNAPAAWCQNNVKTPDPDSSYFLWWSSCTSCGTSWRMHFNDDSDNNSRYKLLTEQPAPEETPTLDVFEEWQKWDPSTSSWGSESVIISECDSDVDENGIPTECYTEKINPVLFGIGVALVICSAFVMLPVIVFLACCQNCNCPEPSASARVRHGGRSCNNHYYGGGCGGGGGGGGCGGGGGGCGGC